jgi:ribosomal protein S27E
MVTCRVVSFVAIVNVCAEALATPDGGASLVVRELDGNELLLSEVD